MSSQAMPLTNKTPFECLFDARLTHELATNGNIHVASQSIAAAPTSGIRILDSESRVECRIRSLPLPHDYSHVPWLVVLPHALTPTHFGHRTGPADS